MKSVLRYDGLFRYSPSRKYNIAGAELLAQWIKSHIIDKARLVLVLGEILGSCRQGIRLPFRCVQTNGLFVFLRNSLRFAHWLRICILSNDIANTNDSKMAAHCFIRSTRGRCQYGSNSCIMCPCDSLHPSPSVPLALFQR